MATPHSFSSAPSNICVQQSWALLLSSRYYPITFTLITMLPVEAETHVRSLGQGLPPQQSRHASSPGLLKRNPSPLSVRLRPNPSKRLKLSSTAQEKAETNIPSNPMAGGLPSRTKRHTQMPRSSDPVRRAKAEEWFDDSNRNVSGVRNASFPDSNSTWPIRFNVLLNSS